MNKLTREHRTPKGAARVESLTEMAMDMFLDQGYEAVSLDTLIARVGGSRRNIYRHFGGKEGLFLAAAAALFEEMAAPLKSLDIPLSGDPAAALLLFGRALFDRVLSPRTLAVHRLMIAEAQRFPELAQTAWRSGHEQAADVLGKWIEHRQGAGILRKDRPALLLARQFVDLVVADAQLRAQLGVPPLAEPDDVVKAAIDTFLNGQAVVAGSLPPKGDQK